MAQPLAKAYTPSGRSPAPFCKHFESFAEEADPSSASVFCAVLSQASRDGKVLLRGPLTRTLADESRAGAVDRTASSDWICLDLDGLETPGLPQPPLGKRELRQMAATALGILGLPSDLACTAHASASCGMDPSRLRLHLFFALETPVSPPLAKLWLRKTNLERLEAKIALSANGQSPVWPLDISVADNSRLLFLSPPSFLDGAVDPFPDPDARFVALPGALKRYGMAQALDGILPESVVQKERELVAELREKAGLPKREAKMKQVEQYGETHDVLSNPDRMNIEIVDSSHDEFVRCNVNGGDSRGYYFRKSDPRYMFNFKGEPLFELVEANRDFSAVARDFIQSPVPGHRVQPVLLRDFRANAFYSALLDFDAGGFVESYGVNPITKANFKDFLASHGVFELPEHIQDANIYFDPRAGETPPDFGTVPWNINLYRASEARRNAAPLPAGEPPPTPQDPGLLQRLCPVGWTVLRHVLGDDDECLAAFLNWLASIYQTGRKTMTAWLVTGAEGTGKGLLYQRILQPLFGQRQVVYKEMANLEEQYNGYLREAQFLIVDEYRAYHAGSQMGRLADRLKSMITEPALTIREMRSNQVTIPSYCNLVFLSNHRDAVSLSEGDRRYNVSPWQPEKLEKRYPHLFPESTHLMDLEAERFAGYLEAFETDEKMAMRPVRNAARAKLVTTSMSMMDEFVNAVVRGNLPYFAEVMDVEIHNIIGGPVPRAQETVERFARDAAQNRRTVATLESLRTVFQALTQRRPEYSPRQFRLEMERRGASPKRTWTAARDRQVRGIPIEWDTAVSLERAREIVRTAGDLTGTLDE